MGDLLESIFGGIPTPSDEAEEDWIRALPRNPVALSGATTIEDFDRRFGTHLEVGPFQFWAQRIETNRITEVVVELGESREIEQQVPSLERTQEDADPMIDPPMREDAESKGPEQ